MYAIWAKRGDQEFFVADGYTSRDSAQYDINDMYSKWYPKAEFIVKRYDLRKIKRNK